MLDAKPGEQLLEIGFGTGHCLIELAKSVGPEGMVHGIDISENMLARTEDLLESENLAHRVALLCGDAEQLPYGSETMDGVFMSFTLELFHTPTIPRVLAECRRVLRPAGRIVVVGLSKEGEGGLMIRVVEWTHRHFPNLLDCRPIYIRRALEAADFRVKNTERRSMWVPVEVILAVKS
jgi:demethylmenaquinone methyltransferase/2-methoxy-6-polyprenyl-1,4-benzoquinol methylase